MIPQPTTPVVIYADKSLSRVVPIFVRLRDILYRAIGTTPEIILGINLSPPTSARAMAITFRERPETPYFVAVQPRLAMLDEAHIEGVLMHELGHIFADRWGYHEHLRYDDQERGVDLCAEYLFGKLIYYDRDGIETTWPGGGAVRPRPDGLR